MNFQRTLGDDEGEGTLNLTSLIDVMFLLVIFFAVSTSFRVYPGLTVNLPKAGAGQIVEDDRSLTATLSEDGEIRLGDEKVAWADLEKALKARQELLPATMFILMADDQVPHGRVVAVMDLARKVGIQRLGIATRRVEEAGEAEGSAGAAGGAGGGTSGVGE